jgi:hypothetical protein
LPEHRSPVVVAALRAACQHRYDVAFGRRDLQSRLDQAWRHVCGGVHVSTLHAIADWRSTIAALDVFGIAIEFE